MNDELITSSRNNWLIHSQFPMYLSLNSNLFWCYFVRKWKRWAEAEWMVANDLADKYQMTTARHDCTKHQKLLLWTKWIFAMCVSVFVTTSHFGNEWEPFVSRFRKEHITNETNDGNSGGWWQRWRMKSYERWHRKLINKNDVNHKFFLSTRLCNDTWYALHPFIFNIKPFLAHKS